jgi:hypothetical protein
LPGRHGEHLVRHHKAEQHAVDEADAALQLLGEGKAHQGIAQIDDELRERRFKQRAAAENEGKPGELPGAGDVRHADGHAARHGHHAERDGDGKITQANGHAVVKARPERILDGRGGLLCLLQGEHLEKRMGRGRGYLKNSPPSLPSGV